MEEEVNVAQFIERLKTFLEIRLVQSGVVEKQDIEDILTSISNIKPKED